MSIKFGFNFETDVSWEELLRVSQELDRNSNFDHVWVTDGLVGRDPDGPRLEAWTALAALAQATSRLRLGVMVTGNVFRHPAVLAKMATTVDHVSGGRLEFGIGAGFPGEVRLVPFPSTKERLDRLEEAVRLIKLLWTEPRPTFEGRYYRLDAAPYSPANVQQPHPPVLIGGGGEKRTLRIVAEHADKANLEGTPEEVRHKFEVLDEHCRAVGRDPATIVRTLEIILFLNDDPAFQQRVVEGLMASPEGLGRSAEDARRFVLLGSADHVRAQIEEFIGLGVQEIILWQYPQLHMKSLRRFSEEVIPAFR